MNNKCRDAFRQIENLQGGYTLIEAIIALAVCGAGLAMILGLYGMAIKTEMVSKKIFEQSLEINSIRDEINLRLAEKSEKSLAERVSAALNSKYPDYQLAGVEQDDQNGLYRLEILHQKTEGQNKQFYIKLFWRQDE